MSMLLLTVAMVVVATVVLGYVRLSRISIATGKLVYWSILHEFTVSYQRDYLNKKFRQ